MEEEITRQCANCGATIPIIFGFRTWCDRCDWNLEDTSYQHPHGLFEITWDWMARRRAPKANRTLTQAALEPPMARLWVLLARGLVFLLALLVHGITLVLFYLGFRLLLLPLFYGSQQFLIISIVQWIAAAVILLLASKIFPRFPRMPADAIRREHAPMLFRLTDRVAAGLKVPPVQAIALTTEFSASYEEMGLRAERVLCLGLPALMALNHQEMVALVAHALSHHRTGDPRRSWLVNSGMETLVEWHRIFRLDRLYAVPVPGLAGIVGMVLQFFAWAFATFFWAAAVLIAWLVYPILRHSELLADQWSARVAGSHATAELLRKGHLRGSYNNILVKAAYTPGMRVLREIRQRLSAVPEREMMRIQRIIDRGEARLGITHPPTCERLGVLQSQPEQPGEITITASEHARMMAEIAPFEASVEQLLLETVQHTHRHRTVV